MSIFPQVVNKDYRSMFYKKILFSLSHLFTKDAYLVILLVIMFLAVFVIICEIHSQFLSKSHIEYLS